jgi:hypothetical protein
VLADWHGDDHWTYVERSHAVQMVELEAGGEVPSTNQSVELIYRLR